MHAGRDVMSSGGSHSRSANGSSPSRLVERNNFFEFVSAAWVAVRWGEGVCVCVCEGVCVGGELLVISC